MAICFELVINFGNNMDAARSAVLTRAKGRGGVLPVGDRWIPLHGPVLSSDGPYITLSICPMAVGIAVAGDGSLPRFELTPAEMTELGNGLYKTLATFDGYVAATVGWDPESLIDPTELKTTFMDELRDGGFDGLVLSDALHAELGLEDDYAVFQPGYRWRPYRGQ
ncbi:hypothetical protein [Nocardia stercoris]|uniref:hypothetical protein n=1 Tax=Nocardia stercoris TaxID=2483361 RepID=UPI0011C36272|nr:hypothetical protein [Nocardia stercoris]